jgi:hypothetical protein
MKRILKFTAFILCLILLMAITQTDEMAGGEAIIRCLIGWMSVAYITHFVSGWWQEIEEQKTP